MPGYTLEDGQTLKNKLGATSSTELDRLETPFVAIRLTEIAMGAGPRGDFDLQHLKALHHHIFQDVFEWAGHSRDEHIRLSDGVTAHQPTLRKMEGRDFAIGPQIPARLNRVLTTLAAEDHWRGLDRDAFALKAGELLAELNSVHPFREGNGRTQRAFMAALGEQAGHQMRFYVVSRERMYQASVAAHENGDAGGFQRMIREITDPQRVAALREAQGFLDRHRNELDWRDHYMATTEEGRSYTLLLVGRAGPNFMGRTNSEILIGRASDLPDPPPQNGETITITTAVHQAKNQAETQRSSHAINVKPTGGGEDSQKSGPQKI